MSVFVVAETGTHKHMYACCVTVMLKTKCHFHCSFCGQSFITLHSVTLCSQQFYAEQCRMILDDLNLKYMYFQNTIFQNTCTKYIVLFLLQLSVLLFFAGKSGWVWVAASNAKKCANRTCQTQFGLSEQPQNCHRLAEFLF